MTQASGRHAAPQGHDGVNAIKSILDTIERTMKEGDAAGIRPARRDRDREGAALRVAGREEGDLHPRAVLAPAQQVLQVRHLDHGPAVPVRGDLADPASGWNAGFNLIITATIAAATGVDGQQASRRGEPQPAVAGGCDGGQWPNRVPRTGHAVEKVEQLDGDRVPSRIEIRHAIGAVVAADDRLRDVPSGPSGTPRL